MVMLLVGKMDGVIEVEGTFQLTGKSNYDAYHEYLASIGLGWWNTDPDNLALPDWTSCCFKFNVVL